MPSGKLSGRLKAYIGLHLAAFIPLAYWAWRLSSPQNPPLLAALLLATVVTGCWRFELTVVRGRQSLVFAVVCLALALQGVAASALCAALGALVTHLFRPAGDGWRLQYLHEPLYRRLFNVSHCADVSMAAGLLWLGLQRWLPGSGWGVAAGLLLFASAYFLLNTWGVATAIALEQGLQPAAVWREHFFWIAPEYLVSGVAAAIIALTYHLTGPAALLLLPCLGLVYRGQRAYVDALRKQRDLVAHVNQLLEKEEQANERKDEFLAMLGHELRNPLAAMRNSLALLRYGSHDDPARIAVLERQVANLTRLVDDLLDTSRITRGNIQLRSEPLELTALASHAVETVQPLVDARGHHLIVSLPSRPIVVQGDPTRLEQVITNLLVNAAKYTEPCGDIELSVEIEERPNDGDPAGAGSPTHCVVRVADSGVGIATDQLTAVFEPFRQVDRSRVHSQGGLGIGLTLVKRLVELHGGTVEAHSAGLGKGSEFVVRLPVVSGQWSTDRGQWSVVSGQPGTCPRLPSVEDHPGVAEPPANSTGAPATYQPMDAPTSSLSTERDVESVSPLTTDHGVSSGPLTTDRLRVLVVDDNTDAVESLGDLLEIWGYEVEVASDGITAVRTAQDFRPHVVLCDIGLPGMDGYEVARRLREDFTFQRSDFRPGSREAGSGSLCLKPEISDLNSPVLVALTGYGQESDRLRAREAGFDYHLVKPVDLEELRRLLMGCR